MGLLSLPPEILSVICQHAILADLGPEKRLHPCTNCRYLRKGFRRRELPCPPLLLCCRDLFHLGSEVFYQNVTIVHGLDHHSQPFYFRCYPTPETDKDTFSVITHRKLVLPYIRNLELMISRSTSYNPRTLLFRQDIFFRSFCEDPALRIRKLTSSIPSLKTLSWSVGLGAVANESIEIWPHVAKVEGVTPADDDEIVFHLRSTWPTSLTHYHTLSSVLKDQPGVLQATSFRLWLTHGHLQRLIDYVHGSGTPEESFQVHEDGTESRIVKLPGHPFLKAIVALPALTSLDIFIPQDESSASPWATRRGTQSIDDDTVDKLKESLRTVFWHVDQVRFWRAHSENVTSGDFAPF
ncbi:hypothetical protein H2200_002209 [Cladophialophora chaetospira]|uniref:F-box domain-containing protein n=1 Tax=Cladophialophora chaetospira TaxID=386627 RepID=A0AA38XJ72_9EURO|nr:hypothetical protein H2200_002209 [Cladophialophora chaetospira]